jgi:hypothetical protein
VLEKAMFQMKVENFEQTRGKFYLELVRICFISSLPISIRNLVSSTISVIFSLSVAPELPAMFNLASAATGAGCWLLFAS